MEKMQWNNELSKVVLESEETALFFQKEPVLKSTFVLLAIDLIQLD